MWAFAASPSLAGPRSGFARHLGYCPVTVRTVLRRFQTAGVPAVPRRRPGPAPLQLAQRRAVRILLCRSLAEKRTWTAPQLAVVPPDGPAPAPIWAPVPRSLRSADLLQCLQEALPHADRLLVVVLDNGSLHSNREFTAARPQVAAARTQLCSLQLYNPELNAIEWIFRSVKDHLVPARRYEILTDLEPATDAGFEQAETRLLVKYHDPTELSAW